MMAKRGVEVEALALQPPVYEPGWEWAKERALIWLKRIADFTGGPSVCGALLREPQLYLLDNTATHRLTILKQTRHDARGGNDRTRMMHWAQD